MMVEELKTSLSSLGNYNKETLSFSDVKSSKSLTNWQRPTHLMSRHNAKVVLIFFFLKVPRSEFTAS